MGAVLRGMGGCRKSGRGRHLGLVARIFRVRAEKVLAFSALWADNPLCGSGMVLALNLENDR